MTRSEARRQGTRRGMCQAKEAWKAFRRTGDVSQLGGPEHAATELAEERRFWPHLTDGLWEAFAEGFDKGRAAEGKRLTRSFTPPALVKKAPMICALVDAMRSFEGADQSWGRGPAGRQPLQVGLSGTAPTRSSEASRAGAALAEADWKAFASTQNVGYITLSDQDLAARAELAFEERGKDLDDGAARVRWVESFKDGYGWRLDREIAGLIPKRLQEWAQHIRALFSLMRLDHPATAAPPQETPA